MSRSGPRGSVAMALTLALMAVGGTAGLVAVMKGTQPTPPPPTPTPTSTTATTAVVEPDAGPISFRDPENQKHWDALRPQTDAIRTSIAALEKATALPSDDLEARCAALFADAIPLAGEGHKDVRSYAEGAKRLCDYDRSLALLGVVVRVQKASPAKTKEEKRVRCDFAAVSAKRLTDRGYGDDEKAKTALAEVGKACL